MSEAKDGASSGLGDMPSPATKVTYLEGKPTTITLRKCKLSVAHGGKVQEYLFDKDVVTIGAMDDNDLVIIDDTVSRNHCKIFVERDNYIVQDLESTNGTFVNRVRIREAFLYPEQVLMLGKSEIRFSSVEDKVRIVPASVERFGDLIGRDRRMREIYAILEKIAPTDATVIIEGETGTGKEVVARTLHQESRRRDGPFMVFDCGAVPENLIESELFGHEKGSFTGAHMTRQGVFEMAHGGTVFLDELGELQLDLQPKLLRVLEQREVRRIGGAKPIKVDVRVVAATNRKLEEEVRAGRFREDLFYRLSVVRVQLPGLAERRDDVRVLAKHFLENGTFNRGTNGPRVRHFAPGVLDRLSEYKWPGNVRELHNTIERAVSFADGDTVELRDLPEHIAWPRGAPSSSEQEATATSEIDGVRSGLTNLDGTFKDAKEKWVGGFERDYIAGLLKRNNFNISHAAREADIDRKYFRKLMKKYDIRVQGDDDDDD